MKLYKMKLKIHFIMKKIIIQKIVQIIILIIGKDFKKL